MKETKHLLWRYPNSQLRGSCDLDDHEKDDMNPALESKVQYLFFSGRCVVSVRTSEIQLAVCERIDVC